MVSTLRRVIGETSRVLHPLASLSSFRIRCFGASACARGLDEFFPPNTLEKGELAEESVKTGRRWKTRELRVKSSEDLHKLWYVLLKERNMLNTLMHEARRQGVPMPSPERYHKVKKSMASIKTVIGERERVLKELEKQKWIFDSKATQINRVKKESFAKMGEEESKLIHPESSEKLRTAPT